MPLAAVESAGAQEVIGELIDVSEEFQKLEHAYFVGARLAEFDAATGEGSLQRDRYERRPSLTFNKLDMAFSRAQSNEFPGTEYDRDPSLKFDISFVSPRTVGLRFNTRHVCAGGVFRMRVKQRRHRTVAKRSISYFE